MLSDERREAKGKRGRFPVRRILRAALVAVLSAYAVYLVAINVFLSTSLFQTVLGGDPETILIEFDRGWSIFPGRIHAKNLAIRSRDSNVLWRLTLDEVVFDVSFFALADHRFEVSRARGRGIRMLAQQTRDRAPDSAEEIARLPPIPGFPAYAIRPAGPPSPERWDDRQYHLWTVRLDDVVAESVREIWIDEGRFEGNARIAGRFYLKPIRAVEIGPAHVDIADGRVTVGRDQVAVPSVAGSFDLTVTRFDPREVHDEEFLRYLSFASELEARVADVEKIPWLRARGFALSGEIEATRIAPRIEQGRLAPGSHLAINATRASVAIERHVVTSDIDVVAEVTPDALLQVRARGHDVALVRESGKVDLRVPAIVATLDARALDLVDHPLADAHARAEVLTFEVDDARELDRFVPPKAPLAILGGAVRGEARLEVWRAEHRAAGEARLDARNLDVRLAKMRSRGAFSITGRFASYDWESRTFAGAGLDIGARDVALSSERAPDRAKVITKEGKVSVTADRLLVDDPFRDLATTFELRHARVTDFTMLDKYLPQGRQMSLGADGVHFDLGGEVVVEDHVARGKLHASAPTLALALGDLAIRGDIRAEATVHDWRWEHGDLAIDRARVIARGVRIAQGDQILARAGLIDVVAKSPAFTFADPLARVDLKAALDDGVVSDPRALDAFLPPDAVWGLASGKPGRFDGHLALAIAKHVARGNAQARAEGLGLRTAPLSILADTDVDLAIGRWDLDFGTIDLDRSRITLTRVVGRFASRPGLEKEKAPADPAAEGAEIAARRIELVGTTRGLDLAHPDLRMTDARLVFDAVELADARALQRALPPGNALRIESGRARADGSLVVESSRKTASGQVDVRIDRGGIALEGSHLEGNFGLHAIVRGYDPATQAFDVSGSTFAMREVSVRGPADAPGAARPGWRADVRLDRATLHLGEVGPDIDAVARIDADDARPVLDLLLRDALPKFVRGLVRMPNLAAFARIRLGPDVWMLSDVDASGGDVAVRGAYALVGEERRGAFVVEKGPVSVGVYLGTEGATPRFFNLDGWLAAEKRDVAARVQAGVAKAKRR